MLTLALIATLFLFGKYTYQAYADGIVIPRDGIIPISSLGQGIITRILVNEGQIVQKNQPVLELKLDRVSVNGNHESEAAPIMLLRRTYLQQTLQDRSNAFFAQKKDIEARIKFAKRRIENLETKTKIERNRAQSAITLYKKWSSEAGDVLSKVQIAQQHDQALQQEATAIESEDQLLQYRQELSQMLATLAQTDAAETQLRAQLQQNLADATVAVVEHDIRQAEIIKAPVSGMVASISSFPGQMIKDGQGPLLTLVPKGNDYLVEAWIDTKTTQPPVVGQTAIITLNSSNFIRTHIKAKVTMVSSTPFSPDQIKSLRGINLEGPRYRLILEAIESTDKLILGHNHPGMTVSVRIMFKNTSFLNWLFPFRQET